jgi:hypothetical protein
MRWKSILCFLFTIIIVRVAFAGETEDTKQFYGQWIVTRYIPTRGIHGIYYEEADAYKGTVVLYGDKIASFGTEKCSQPNYITSVHP